MVLHGYVTRPILLLHRRLKYHPSRDTVQSLLDESRWTITAKGSLSIDAKRPTTANANVIASHPSPRRFQDALVLV